MNSLELLKEHIQELRKILANPSVTIKTFSGLIKELERISDLRSDGKADEVKQHLSALHTDEKTLDLILEQHHEINEVKCITTYGCRKEIFDTQALLMNELARVDKQEGVSNFAKQVEVKAQAYEKKHTWCRSTRQLEKKQTLQTLSQQSSCLMQTIRMGHSPESLPATLEMMRQLIATPSLVRRGTLVSLVFGCLLDPTSGTYRTLTDGIPGDDYTYGTITELAAQLKSAELRLDNAIAVSKSTVSQKASSLRTTN